VGRQFRGSYDHLSFARWYELLSSTLLLLLLCRSNAAGFKKSGAVPIVVGPGDVVFHNILVLHGSTHSEGPLRRTVYYEYRAIGQEIKMGPHIPEYVPLKQRMWLLFCFVLFFFVLFCSELFMSGFSFVRTAERVLAEAEGEVQRRGTLRLSARRAICL
jgi:hypothetical protein